MPQMVNFYPPRRLARLVHFLESQGHSCVEAMRAAGLSHAMMDLEYIPINSIFVLLQEMLMRTGRTDLGFVAALEIPIGSDDIALQLLLNAPRLRDAFLMLAKYSTLLSPVLHLTVHERDDGGCTLELRLKSSLAYEVGLLLLESIALSGHKYQQFALQDRMLPCTFAFSWPTPAHAYRYREIPGAQVRFGLGGEMRALMHYGADVAMRPMPNADARVHQSVERKARLAVTALERELSYSEWTRHTLVQMEDEMLTQESAARLLQMSARTLARHLEREGAAFGEIAHEVRIERARQLLATSDMSIHDIGLKLGFASQANFARSFKARTGNSPSQFRQLRQCRQAGQEPA